MFVYFYVQTNFNLWNTTFNFRNGRYNLSYFRKIAMPSATKVTFLKK